MKAYLVTLTGQGDIDRKLIDQEAWDFLNDGGIPADSVIDRYLDDRAEPEATRQDVIDHLTSFTGSSVDNDRALALSASLFGEERFDGGSTKAAVAFCAKHGLDLSDDEYDGYIY